MSMSQLEREIFEQPNAIARLLDEGWWGVIDAAQRIRAFDPEWMLIAARGTSDNAARYAQYLFGSVNRLAVGLAVPSLHTLYRTPPRLGRAVVLGISQSGQSPDVVSVLVDAGLDGALTIALTNDPSSPLAHVADMSIPLIAGPEQAIAATKTYTNELISIAMLSSALADDEGRLAALHFVPRAVADALSVRCEIEATAKAMADTDRYVVLGRGFNYCTAFEIALKMKETGCVVAEPYSVADFLHGPIAMIDQRFAALVVAPSGCAADCVADVLAPLRARKVRVVAVSDREDLLAHAHARIPLPVGVPEWLSPIVSVVPGQLWSWALSRALGRDPDRPRGLHKVTMTF